MPFPFFLAYAAAVLEKNGIEVTLVDAIAEGDSEDRFMDKIREFAPDLILLETSTPSIYHDLEIAEKIKNKFDAKIVFSGAHVSVLYDEILGNGLIDYILIGEYEYTLLDLVTHLAERKSLEDVKGLAYTESGVVKVNPRRQLVNLDELPWPARHFLPMDAYNDTFCDLPQPSAQMVTSRGCPFKCVYCLWPKVMYGGPAYRTRDSTDVVKEMKWLTREYNLKSIYFDDDTFNIGKNRILEICEEIKKNDVDVPWAVMARADTSDKRTLKAMRDAGLYAIKYGVESGVQEIVDASRKKLDLNKVRDTVRETKELGIKVHLTFTFGLPDETWDTIKKTVDFAIELDPDSLQFSITTPYPGTDYFEWAEKRGFILTKDWSKYDGSTTSIIRTEKMDENDLREAIKMAVDTWHRHSLKKKIRNDPVKCIIKGLRKPAKGIRALAKLM